MIAWAFQAALGVSLTMLLVLALRRPVAFFFGAQWAYALWILPPLRLILPPLALPRTPVEAIGFPSEAVLAGPDAGFVTPDLPGLLLALWLGGAALYLSWQQSSYGAFLLHLGPSGSSGEPPDFGGIRVVESDAVDGPIAVGIWNKRIVVPVDFRTRYSPAEQQLALMHELVHHRRHDILWNLVALIMLAVNWFNPIAHFAFRAFRADQELACDAAVARAAPQARCDYARALVKSASQSGLLTAAPLNHAAFLKRRLKMMHRHRGSWPRTIGGLAAFMLAAGGALVLSGPGQAQPEAEAVAPALVAAEGPSAPIHAAAVQERAGQLGRCRKLSVDHALRVRNSVAQPVKRATPEVVPLRVAAPDPELFRRIERDVEAALQQAEVQIAAAAQQHAHAAKIAARVRREAAAEAPVRAAAARQAIARARMQLAAIDVRAVEFAELDRTAAVMVRVQLDRRERAELRQALREARREIERSDFSAELEDLDAEIERSLDEIDDLDDFDADMPIR